MVYAPAELVWVSVATPVAVFLAETVAFGMAPPWASVIVPDSVAPETCARSGSEVARLKARRPTKSTNAVNFDMGSSFVLRRNNKSARGAGLTRRKSGIELLAHPHPWLRMLSLNGAGVKV